MGLCLLLPFICGQELCTEYCDSVNEEDSENENRRTQTKSMKITSPMKSKQSKSPPPIQKGKIKTNKWCLLCSRPVHSSSLIVGNRFSVNTPMMDERNSGIFCSCDTSYFMNTSVSNKHTRSKKFAGLKNIEQDYSPKLDAASIGLLKCQGSKSSKSSKMSKSSKVLKSKKSSRSSKSSKPSDSTINFSLRHLRAIKDHNLDA